MHSPGGAKWAATQRTRQIQALAVALVCMVAAIMLLRWQLSADGSFDDTGFSDHALRLHEGSLPGSTASAGNKQATSQSTASEAADQEFMFSHKAHIEDVNKVWPYTCWTPKKLSSPVLTMVTILGGLPVNYTNAVRLNRLHFAARRGYRYCELEKRIDKFKIPAFTKLPWMLALAPCSEYIIHLDADAMINNFGNSFKPWTDFMESKGIDQLFSTDCIVESPINYGVFMIRTAPWIWNFYKKLYNMCVCDWSRMHDWPAEQGLVYDLLAQDMNSADTKRSMIVPGKGWNHILGPGTYPDKQDVVVHLTYPSIYPEGHPCKNAKEFSKDCKYQGLEYFLTQVIGSKQYLVPDPTVYFDKADNICQDVRYNKLFSAYETYSNQGGEAQRASVMDFDVDPETGKVLGIKLSEVGCLGFREKKCNVPYLWDTKQGVGPWKAYNKDIV